MLVKEYIRYDVHDLANLIKSREVSPEEVLDCALRRIDEVNPKLNAVVTDCYEFARKCLLGMHKDEPFYGVPLLVKDLSFAIEGIKETEGSRFFSSNLSKGTSDFINELMALGFVPFAKTNTPELGLSYVTESSLLGPCRNPYDLTRTPGGSSGGSASAVAAGIAPIATGSDGGGSLRIPAACCGLFGFKPTPGLISTGPWVGESWSGMVANHVLTRSIRDSAAVFRAVAKHNYLMPTLSKKSLTVTQLLGAFPDVPVDEHCLEAIRNIEGILKKSGHKIKQKRVNLDLNAIGQCALILIAANTCAAIRLQQKELGRKASIDELEPITWEFYHRGEVISAHELINAKNKLYQLMRPLHQALSQTDVVLTPALAKLPLLIGQLKTDDEFNAYLQKNTEFSPFTSLFNQAGLPAMTLPIMFHDHLPVSVQLGAAQGHDLTLLSLAEQLQELLPDFTKVTPN